MITTLYKNTKSPKLEHTEKIKKGSWIHVVEPTDDELIYLAEELELDSDILMDAKDLYESPRVEQDGNTVYTFTRYSYPQGTQIATEPLLIIYTDNYLVTVQRNDSGTLNRLLDGSVGVVTTKRTQLFLQILVEINRSYKRHIYSISKQILSFRTQLTKVDLRNQDFINFIYIEEDLNEFLSALQSQAVVLRNLLGGKFLKLYEDDKDLIEDLSLGTDELIELTRTRLKTISNTREAYATIMANTLNQIFRRLTSIGIFLAVPTVIAALYGMNVRLPLAADPNAFWEIVGLSAVITGASIWLFNRLRWL